MGKRKEQKRREEERDKEIRGLRSHEAAKAVILLHIYSLEFTDERLQ